VKTTRPHAAPARRLGPILFAVASTLLAGLLVLLGALLVMSPGTPAPLLDAAKRPLPGSLSEKTYVDINGVRQGMFVKSKDVQHPVLLYLHGGMPDYFLTQRYPTGWEEAFTVVWWEQRGAGISYGAKMAPGTLTLEQLIADTLAVTHYLRQRFAQDKIYLMGHSGGSFLGIQAVARAPQLYHAYIGVAQMSYQLESECLAYDYMLQQFRASGNTRMLKKLEAAPVSLARGTPPGYVAVRDEAMHALGIGTMHEMRSLLTGLVIPSFQFREYTLPEKLTLWRAKSRSGISAVWDNMVRTDLRQQVTELAIPVYFFHGIHDYTVSYALAKSYFDRIQAPVKGFYTFDASAHSPMFEEPEKMNRILRADVLTGSTRLADGGLAGGR
jgi:pimeloyl-ACP methyl ester carboxylesterase